MSEYTDNQIRAIKKIQAMSWNDDEFRKLIPWHNMTFNNVVSSGYWSLDELEQMGKSMSERTVFNHISRTFHQSKGRREPRRKMQRISGKQQASDARRSLNNRYDKPMRVPKRKSS